MQDDKNEKGWNKIELLKGIGKRIRTLRKEQGLTQSKLAEMSGLHRTYLTDLERGARNMSVGSLARVAMSLGISIQTLFEIDAEAVAE